MAQVTGALIDLEEHLNALDAKVGDGDTGSTFAAGARDCRAARASAAAPERSANALRADRRTPDGGDGRLQRVLMSIFFTAAGQKLGQGASVAEALNAGLEQMKFYGGADEGDRTMIDALQPAGGAAGRTGESAGRFRRGAGRGGSHLPVKAGAGRASYLNSESLLGNMDPRPRGGDGV